MATVVNNVIMELIEIRLYTGSLGLISKLCSLLVNKILYLN